jgi:hypothetical protein
MSGTAIVVPAQVPSSGATALGKVTLASPVALPSGTLVEARLTETFTLGAQTFTDEERTQDVLVHRTEPAAATSLRGEIPLTARQTFDTSVPVHGRLHLEPS